MDILIQLFHEKEIEKILEKCEDVKFAKKDEIRSIIKQLHDAGCDDNLIRYLIMTNPSFITNESSKIKEIINVLSEYGIEDLDLVFYLYPKILNKDAYEIDNFYIKKHQEGYSNDDIKELLEVEPYLIDEK